MAIRNDLLGGSDWVNTEKLYAADLNDTFDAIATKLSNLTAVWLYDDLVEVWNDFETYADTAAFEADTTNFTFVTTGSNGATGDFELSSGGLVDGTQKARLKAIGSNYNSMDWYGTAELTTKTLEPNKHTFANVFVAGSSSFDSWYIEFGGIKISEGLRPASGGTKIKVYIFAKGNNQYDVYNGYDLTTITYSNPQLKFYLRARNTVEWTTYMDIDDIQQSIEVIS